MKKLEVPEFPFVAALPKRQAKRVNNVWEKLAELRELTERNGHVVPATFAAKLLGVSRQRVHQLTEAGKLEGYMVDGQPFITERSIVSRAKTIKQKGGRPKLEDNS